MARNGLDWKRIIREAGRVFKWSQQSHGGGGLHPSGVCNAQVGLISTLGTIIMAVF